MREDDVRKAQGRRLAAAREAAGYRSARDAALSCGWPESSYRAHETGTRTIGQDDAERYARRFRAAGAKITGKAILYGDEEEAPPRGPNSVPVMGYIGAGAAIDPELEDVPPEGLMSVELPFPVPDGMIALEVRGDSMLPRYDDGDMVVLWKDQRRTTDSFIGEEAAVRTEQGQRYLKHISPGPRRGTHALHSFNAKPIEAARIAWVGEIYVTVRAGQLRKTSSRERAAAQRRKKPREDRAGDRD